MTSLAVAPTPASPASGARPLSIAVAATFTAEPVEATLRFWMKELGFEAAVEVAAYNQVFQHLLDPASPLGRGSDVNLLLVRPEDWQREAIEQGDHGCATNGSAMALDLAKAQRDVNDFIDAARAAASRGPTPTIVLICPPTPALMPRHGEDLAKLEQRIVEGLAGTALHVIPSRDLAALYPVADYHDAQLDRMGHIPFTEEAFAAIGTMAARRIAAIRRSPRKVIALDCDNTLWRGVVGEDGPEGIRFDAGFVALQQFMIAQSEAGMILCLVSKNIEDDVARVFEVRADMPLREAHIVARKVNWIPKSQNLAALAAELSLGIDSFIFIDDNPVECAEVKAALPQVLVLNLPKDDAAIPDFLRHVWEFDHLKVTSEDRQRTAMYRQNMAREQLLKESVTFDQFLASLDLQIVLREPDAAQMPRVAQLTQRTNQFNFTTIRRSQEEIESLLKTGRFHCLIVEVKDRFGDYGLVGVLLYEIAQSELRVDSFMLSCRVLGRGVEHRMMQRMGEIALERGLPFVNATFVPTKKNVPALNFLQSIGRDHEALLSDRYVFRFPTAFAAQLAYAPPASAPTDLPQEGGDRKTAGEPAQNQSDRAQRTATDLRWPRAVLAAVEAERVKKRGSLGADYAPPADDVQRQLVSIWEDVLDVQPIGIADDFFSLGGDSLGAVRILAEVERAFGRRLPQQVLFERPTIEALQKAIAQVPGGGGAIEVRMPTLVKINERGSKPPFFAVAPADGIGLIYKELARCLGDDQPFYALNRKDLDFGVLRSLSIEGLAEHYIRIMKGVQPVGPYFLGGYCNGTYVAAEIARQLTEAGETVAVLAIFDFWYCKEMPAQTAADQSLRGRWREFRKRDHRALPVVLWSLIKRKLFGAKGAAAVKVAAPQAAEDEDVQLPSTSASDPVRERHVQLGYQLQRLIQYRTPKNVDAPIHYFGSAEGRWKTDYTDGWEKVALRGIDLHIVPGEHRTILIRPNVQTLAEKLKRVLSDAQG